MANRVRASYTIFGRPNRNMKTTVNVMYEANKGPIDREVFKIADRATDIVRSTVMSETPLTPGEGKTFDDYLSNLRTEPVKEYDRKKSFAKGSRIPVALVSVEGASLYGQQRVEYGSGDYPGLYPMTKAVYEMGGDPL